MQKKDFKIFVKKARQWAIEGRVDCIIIDEADMFFETNWDLDPALTDLILNHRHMKVAVWFITRRPQDIPQKIVESCKWLMIFKLEGVGAIKKFQQLNPKIPELLEQMSLQRRHYVVKEIGEEPYIHAPI